MLVSEMERDRKALYKLGLQMSFLCHADWPMEDILAVAELLRNNTLQEVENGDFYRDFESWIPGEDK